LNKGFSIFGEADYVVVSPAGRVLVIEQKSGLLEESPDGLMKLYASKSKSVSAQVARTISGMHGRFKAAFGGQNYRLEEMLYCPDYRVKNPAIAGVNPTRIVDATRSAELVSIITTILPADELPLPCLDRIHAFLADELSLTPDVRAMVGQVAKHVTRVSGGLATWARSIECTPFRLRVTGTAGSGKTQLAIRVLEDAVNAGRRALYLCFNRPLADHIRRIAPAGSTVLTYHQLCEQVARRAGRKVDFADGRVFGMLEEAMLASQPAGDERFDTVVVDEGQDFRQEWVAPIAARQRAILVARRPDAEPVSARNGGAAQLRRSARDGKPPQPARRGALCRHARRGADGGRGGRSVHAIGCWARHLCGQQRDAGHARCTR
jgi:hypothetical protein